MRHGALGGALVLLACGLAAPAYAGGGDDWQSVDSFGVQVGGVVVVSPRYEGSSNYRVIGVPFAAPASAGPGGRIQFKGPDDVRVRVFEHEGFEAGPLVGWRFGRDEEDGRRLWGLGDVDGGLVVGGYLAYRLGNLKPYLSYHHQVTGDNAGGVLRAGTEITGKIGRDIGLTGTVGVSYADGNYMESYFSVSPVQSAASLAGLAVYDAGAGIKDAFVGISADVPLADAWSLKLGVQYARLVGDAADSPVVENENQITGSAAVIYRFNFR